MRQPHPHVAGSPQLHHLQWVSVNTLKALSLNQSNGSTCSVPGKDEQVDHEDSCPIWCPQRSFYWTKPILSLSISQDYKCTPIFYGVDKSWDYSDKNKCELYMVLTGRHLYMVLALANGDPDQVRWHCPATAKWKFRCSGRKFRHLRVSKRAGAKVTPNVNSCFM